MNSGAHLPRRRPPAATLVGLGIALLLPMLTNSLSTHFLGPTSSRALVTSGLVLHWLTLGLLLIIVMRWEGEPLQSIGWRSPRWSTLPFGVLAGLCIAVVSAILSQLLRLRSDTYFLSFLQSLPALERVALVITAGVFEETLYRGYALERLSTYFGGKWVAAVVTVLLFTFAHAPAFGAAQLAPVLLVSVLVTLLYLWRRNLLLNMIAHTTIDAIGLLIVPAFS